MAQPEETQLGSSVPEREGTAFHGVEGGAGLMMRSCSECGRQFSSGKALGGHKRACLQSKNNMLKLKPSTIKMEDIGGKNSTVKVDHEEEGGGGGGGGSDDCRCYVCDQRFMTKKSLYGHMRKHPERQWRGIHPPTLQQQQLHHLHFSGSSTISNDHNNNNNNHDHDHDHENDNDIDDDGEEERVAAVDLVESLKGWSVKDKRGRKSSTSTDTARPSSNSVSKEEEEVDPADKEAASNLFFLAQTLHRYHDSKKRNMDQVGYGVLKIKERRPDTDQETDMKQQKKRKLTELEPSTTTYKFHCPICNKGFEKHQALGGHVASHNNKTKNLVNTMKESSASVEEERQVAAAAAGEAEFDQDESGGGDDDRSSRVNGELGDQHQCNICNKNFPSGQALGGHKRRHWAGPNCPEAISSSSQVTTSTGEVSQTPPRTLLGGLDIDLNDTPQEFYQFFGFAEPSQEPEPQPGAGGSAGAGPGVGSKDNPMR